MDFGRYLEIASAIVVTGFTAFSFFRKLYLKKVRPFFKKFDDLQNQFKAGNGDTMYDKLSIMGLSIANVDSHLALLTNVLNSTLYIDPNPIFKADPSGHFTFVNQAWLRLSGFSSQEEANGTGWLKAILDTERQEVKKYWEEATKSGSVFSMKHYYKNIQTNNKIFVYCRTTLVKDNEGRVLQIIGLLEIVGVES